MIMTANRATMYAHLNSKGYVSCIRIAGIPILPPLINEERRKEILDDRNKAIMIEKRLKNKRNSTDSGVMTGSYTDDTKTPSWQRQNIIQQVLEHNKCYNIDNNSIEDELEDVSNSCQIQNIDDNYVKHAIADDEFKKFLYNNIIRALKDYHIRNTSESDRSSNSGISCAESLDLVATEDHSDDNGTKQVFMKDNFFSSPLDSENIQIDDEKQLTVGWNDEFLSKDMLDVSVCRKLSLISPRLGTGIQEIENKVSQISLDDKINEAIKTDIPILVRRNSYILESPSPALLEHMKNQETKCSLQDLNYNLESSESVDTVKCSENPKAFEFVRKPRKLWNQVEQKAFLERCKNLHSPLLESNNINKQKLNASLPSLTESYSVNHIQRSLSADCLLSLTKDNLIDSHDCVLQNINVNNKIYCNRPPTTVLDDDIIILYEKCNDNVENRLQKKLPNVSFCSPESVSSATENNLPYKYGLDFRTSTKIIQNGTGVQYGDKWLTDSSVDPRREIYPCTTRSDDCFSMCSSISLNKFLPSQEEHVSSPTSTGEDLSQLFNKLKIQHEQQLEELLKRQEEEKKFLSAYNFHSTVLSRNNSSHQNAITNIESPGQNRSGRKSLCNKELFPEKPLEKYSEKENRAAEKICAHVRGYLTRRLLHTERVQQIIETIRESLLCALNLRSESTLKPMDLELNTRLIQQLTSACYDLHDVFSLPVTQRMAIIAVDREKKRKRTSRPNSASISSATKRSLFRKQQSINLKSSKKLPSQTQRARARSCSSESSNSVITTGLTSSSLALKRCSSSHNTRQPWR